LRNCHGSGTIQKDIALSPRLWCLFLELKPLQQKHWEAQQLVQQCPAQQVGLSKPILDQPVALEKASRLTSCDCGTDLRTCTMGTLNEASKFTTTSDAGTLLQLGFVHLLGRMCKFHAAQLRLVGWI